MESGDTPLVILMHTLSMVLAVVVDGLGSYGDRRVVLMVGVAYENSVVVVICVVCNIMAVVVVRLFPAFNQ